MSTEYQGLFEGWEIAIAKKLVSNFRSTSKTLAREEFDDLLQECLFHWHQVRDDVDPERETSRRASMARVIRNKLTDLEREGESDKRKMTYVSLSLDAPVGETEDAPTLIEMIDPHATTDTPSESEPLQLQMKIDIARMLKRLTSRQRKLCHLLREQGLNVKEAAQQMKLPRATVYDELKRIKAVFKREGLEGYLKR